MKRSLFGDVIALLLCFGVVVLAFTFFGKAMSTVTGDDPIGTIFGTSAQTTVQTENITEIPQEVQNLWTLSSGDFDWNIARFNPNFLNECYIYVTLQLAPNCVYSVDYTKKEYYYSTVIKYNGDSVPDTAKLWLDPYACPYKDPSLWVEADLDTMYDVSSDLIEGGTQRFVTDSTGKVMIVLSSYAANWDLDLTKNDDALIMQHVVDYLKENYTITIDKVVK